MTFATLVLVPTYLWFPRGASSKLAHTVQNEALLVGWLVECPVPLLSSAKRGTPLDSYWPSCSVLAFLAHLCLSPIQSRRQPTTQPQPELASSPPAPPSCLAFCHPPAHPFTAVRVPPIPARAGQFRFLSVLPTTHTTDLSLSFPVSPLDHHHHHHHRPFLKFVDLIDDRQTTTTTPTPKTCRPWSFPLLVRHNPTPNRWQAVSSPPA